MRTGTPKKKTGNKEPPGKERKKRKKKSKRVAECKEPLVISKKT